MYFAEYTRYASIQLKAGRNNETWSKLDETVGNAFLVVIIDAKSGRKAIAKVYNRIDSNVVSLEVRVRTIRRDTITDTGHYSRRQETAVVVVLSCENIQRPVVCQPETAIKTESQILGGPCINGP